MKSLMLNKYQSYQGLSCKIVNCIVSACGSDSTASSHKTDWMTRTLTLIALQITLTNLISPRLVLVLSHYNLTHIEQYQITRISHDIWVGLSMNCKKTEIVENIQFNLINLYLYFAQSRINRVNIWSQYYYLYISSIQR